MNIYNYRSKLLLLSMRLSKVRLRCKGVD